MSLSFCTENPQCFSVSFFTTQVIKILTLESKASSDLWPFLHSSNDLKNTFYCTYSSEIVQTGNLCSCVNCVITILNFLLFVKQFPLCSERLASSNFCCVVDSSSSWSSQITAIQITSCQCLILNVKKQQWI